MWAVTHARLSKCSLPNRTRPKLWSVKVPNNGRTCPDTSSFRSDWHPFLELCTAFMEEFQSTPPTTNAQQPFAIMAEHLVSVKPMDIRPAV